MGRQEAVEQYAKALKMGQRAYKDSVLHGNYPYPPVLDEILMDDALIAGQADMGRQLYASYGAGLGICP